VRLVPVGLGRADVGGDVGADLAGQFLGLALGLGDTGLGGDRRGGGGLGLDDRRGFAGVQQIPIAVQACYARPWLLRIGLDSRP